MIIYPFFIYSLLLVSVPPPIFQMLQSETLRYICRLILKLGSRNEAL